MSRSSSVHDRELKYWKVSDLIGIYQPLVLEFLESKNHQIRTQAVANLAQLFQVNYNSKNRQMLFEILFQTFGSSPSFTNRLTFLQISQALLLAFSREFANDNFTERLLELADDRVSNVRFKFIGILFQLQLAVRGNAQLSARLSEKISKYSLEERSPDVQQVRIICRNSLRASRSSKCSRTSTPTRARTRRNWQRRRVWRNWSRKSFYQKEQEEQKKKQNVHSDPSKAKFFKNKINAKLKDE